MAEPSGLAGQLTSPYGASPMPVTTQRRSPWVVVPLQVVLILVVFAGAGLLCGLLWEAWWTAPRGAVGIDAEGKHVWYPVSERALRGEFTGTGMFVVIGLGAGALVGGVCAWVLARVELVSVIAIAAGAALAAYLTMRLGVHLGPPDEQSLALTLEEGARLPEHLRLSGGLAPYLTFPIGAMAATGLVLFVPRRRR